MKMAVKDGGDLLEELVPVILVGHGIDEAGSRRTRRLFTTLNKTAIPVNKKDIIALDEDDVMAITARRMVERDPGFKDPKVAVVASESMPANNHESLITIAALYDLLKLLFMHRDNARGDYKLRFNRPPDDELDAYHTTAKNYFAALGRAFPPMAEFLKARNPGQVVPKYRTGEGGHILFRALGLEIATRAAIAAAKRDGSTIEKAVADVISKMPVDLAQPPYAGIIWDTARSTIRPANKTLARRLVFHMLRLPVSARQQATLEGDFRAALGYERDDAKVKLPKPVI
jgi:DNA sulfur modification protein DndB